MKHLRTFVLVVLGLLVFATASWAARAPKSAIAGSAHDFMAGVGTTTWTAGSYALCNFCHIAHKFGSAPSGPGYLLWNHTLSSKTSYGVYTSDSMVSTPTELGTNGGGNLVVSNLCLSCHDGTVAINSWYEGVSSSTYSPLPQGTEFMPEDTTVSDLTKQHPINFVYPSATDATKIGLRPAADTHSVDGDGNVPLYNGTMQCATCHDPHAGNVHYFFRSFPQTAEVVSTGSSCVYCHL
jgi:hypothetical protein